MQEYQVHDLISLPSVAKSIISKLPTNQYQQIAILLNGEMGVGKTTFTQVFIKALLSLYHKNTSNLLVTSPTFNIVHSYEYDEINLHHIDLYRLESPCELEELNLPEMLMDGICLIEWANKFDLHIFLPKHTICYELQITMEENASRKIVCTKL